VEEEFSKEPGLDMINHVALVHAAENDNNQREKAQHLAPIEALPVRPVATIEPLCRSEPNQVFMQVRIQASLDLISFL
jgi:hypothetical protein